MHCTQCGRTLRWDERLAQGVFAVEVAPGVVEQQNTWGCPDCVARSRGEEPPESRRYPPGSRIPRHPLQTHLLAPADMPICGLCRIALPWGQDQGTLIRLRAEVLAVEDLEAGIEPGDAYVACHECVAHYRPRLHAYLKAACRVCDRLNCTEDGHSSILSPGASEVAVVGDLLA